MKNNTEKHEQWEERCKRKTTRRIRNEIKLIKELKIVFRKYCVICTSLSPLPYVFHHSFPLLISLSSLSSPLPVTATCPTRLSTCFPSLPALPTFSACPPFSLPLVLCNALQSCPSSQSLLFLCFSCYFILLSVFFLFNVTFFLFAFLYFDFYSLLSTLAIIVSFFFSSSSSSGEREEEYFIHDRLLFLLGMGIFWGIIFPL